MHPSQKLDGVVVPGQQCAVFALQEGRNFHNFHVNRGMSRERRFVEVKLQKSFKSGSGWSFSLAKLIIKFCRYLTNYKNISFRARRAFFYRKELKFWKRFLCAKFSSFAFSSTVLNVFVFSSLGAEGNFTNPKLSIWMKARKFFFLPFVRPVSVCVMLFPCNFNFPAP